MNVNSNPALCILAAGLGNRLGNFTENFNKALLPLAGKATISHIIDKTSSDVDIIVAVGHKSDSLKEYCLAAHPNRKFTFIDVFPYEGKCSGPGKSLEACYELLQRPFYLSVVDCLVEKEWPNLENDWIGVASTEFPEQFSTVKVVDDKIVDLKNKRADGYQTAFIGLAGIVSYEQFWNALLNEKQSEEVELVVAFQKWQTYPGGIRVHEFEWYDTGTVANYNIAREHFERNKIDFSKPKEITYIVGERIIKIFSDSARVKRCIQRANNIPGTPSLTVRGNNIFGYEYVPGRTIYDEIQSNSESTNLQPSKLYTWLESKLWFESFKDYELKDSCMRFYRDKTLERYALYKSKKKITNDNPSVINGIVCKSIEDYLDNIDWEKLTSNPIVCRFHGDLQFDNIIKNDSGEFTLLDWRDSFDNVVEVGDARYDFAKLYGGMMLPYDKIKNGCFSIVKSVSNSQEVTLDWEVPYKLEDYKNEFFEFLKVKNVNLQEIELLTSLIYLNMAPLHSSPFDEFLFNLAKLRFGTK
jgi:NDP-sugar pyrophosphorylase family protein